MNQELAHKSGFASIVVRLAGIWILAGAVAKLYVGSPKDLPELVRRLSPFELDLTFHLVIAVELALVSLAWLRPKLAWPLIVALFVFFDWILVSQLRAGAESCGCFGGSIEVDPRIMLAVDSTLLLALLASRPWSTISTPNRARLSLVALGACLAVSFALPWIKLPPSTPGPAGTTATEAPRYVILDPAKWVNHAIYDIDELTRWVDPGKLPTDGKVVLWRQGCEHCAAHLRLLASRDDGSQPILLVQIRDDLKDGRQVDLMPDGAHVTRVEFPENLQVVLQTPWELAVSGGVVTAALDEKQAKEQYEKGG